MKSHSFLGKVTEKKTKAKGSFAINRRTLTEQKRK